MMMMMKMRRRRKKKRAPPYGRSPGAADWGRGDVVFPSPPPRASRSRWSGIGVGWSSIPREHPSEG